MTRMRRLRVIPRLDIKNDKVIKGIQLEGLRVVGDPSTLARQYYEDGADELLYMDVVASLYQRNSLREIVEKTSRDVFIPLTVGGGVRTLDDIRSLLRSGADKVAINTAAVHSPEFVREAARSFGAQCIVASVEAKRTGDGAWEAYTDNGRNRTGLDVVRWVERLVELGAGEILLTSVDAEGVQRGFDLPLVERIASAVPVPLIVCGGAGTLEHFAEVAALAVDAIAAASVFHYGKLKIAAVKERLARVQGPVTTGARG